MGQRTSLALTIISLIVLGLLVVLTNPIQAGPMGILSAYILLYLSLLGVVAFLLFWGWRAIAELIHIIFHTIHIRPLTFRRSYAMSIVIAMLPMMAIGLHAAAALSWYSVLLLVLFGVIGILYVQRRI